MTKRKLEEDAAATKQSEADASDAMSILRGSSGAKKGRVSAAKMEESDVDLDNALAGLLSVSDTMRRLDKKIRLSRAKKGSSKKGELFADSKAPAGYWLIRTDVADGPVSHKSWTIIEEVFLVGVVVDMFLSRGSLSPKHYGESCWLVIKRNYDRAWAKYLEYLDDFKSGKIPEDKQAEFPFLKTMYHTTIDNHERTQGAMARHFKEMKDRCAKGTTRNFSYFLREWEEIVSCGARCMLFIDFFA